jgi:Leucine-rich repeat (LRR) protein
MRNGLNLKATKALQAAVQVNYGLVRLDVHEKGCKLARDKGVIEVLTNIEWYLQSNRNFLSFLKGHTSELNMCGRSIPSLEGMTFRHVTTMNMSHNYLTKLPTSISTLTQLVDLNLSHNDLITLPSAIGQLERWAVCCAVVPCSVFHLWWRCCDFFFLPSFSFVVGILTWFCVCASGSIINNSTPHIPS